MAMIQRIIPSLWFDHEAEDAARFYVSIFERSHIGKISRYLEEGSEIHKQKPGSVMTVEFELDGVRLTALNGGPTFKLNEAMSLQVICDTQAEIDAYWSALAAGGDEAAQQCGWLKDRFGLSWQILPAALADLVGDANTEKAGRAVTAMLRMKKLDLAELRRAHAG